MTNPVEHSESKNKTGRYVRPVKELWEIWKPRVKYKVYPFTYANYEDVERVMTSLTFYDHDKWAAAWSAIAKPYEEKAAQAEKAGNAKSAKENYLIAYQYYRMARYPTINSEGKKEAYRKSQEMLLAASRYFDVPLQRVEIPFKGKSGEGNKIVAYLRLPKTASAPFPVLVTWGGIDGFKEEQLNDPALEHGLATLAIDGPGVGDSPLKGSEDAERLFGAVFDWIATQKNFDPRKAGVWGYSTGGYWAVKVAHLYKDKLACAVSQGGPVHYAFELDWIKQQERGEYPFEFFETISFAFGLSGYDEWVQYAPKLSLLKQGILDKPCAPLLLVNGIHDSVFPIKDYYLLLEHGSPKCARFYEAGHMGFTRDTFETIMNWIYEKIG
ncbi:MAG TPA: alpha/beta fold hydrolase [Candidatus Limnocylindrales bacterium]|nr:alpha/beta fold hydrolase [Candidatus Limnocylindrales bacterium]